MRHPPSNSPPIHRTDRVLLALLVLSLACNVALGARAVRSHLRTLRIEALSAPLKPGSLVPSLEANRLGGGREPLLFGRGDTILYFLSSTCGWCERNISNLRAVATQLKPGTSLLLISLDRGEQAAWVYAARLDLNVPFYFDPDADGLRAYHVTGTPSTILVSRDRRVIKAFSGAYTGPRKILVEELFGIALPGLD